MTPQDRAITQKIMGLCVKRGASKTICPSEVARHVAGEADDWRALMPDVRRIAGTLAAAGHVVVTQRGDVVDPLTQRGALRIGLRERR